MAEKVRDGAIGTPAPALRRFVDRYVGYRQEGYPPGIHRGLPSRHLTFIVSLGPPVDIAAMPGNHPGGSFDAFVSGLHSSQATITHDGTQKGVQMSLTPLGARALFGLPAGELAGEVAPLDELVGRVATELADRMVDAPSWCERFEVIDEVLARLVNQQDQTREPPAEVTEAWRRLTATDGRLEVGALARDLGWSRRHLGERFRLETGLTPKVAARVMRFERSRRWIEREPARSLAAVAAECGYFDQAHMARDWNDIAGCSPTVWMAEELPSVQDEAVVAVAS
jgi:AraC-like DNA-binding protein